MENPLDLARGGSLDGAAARLAGGAVAALARCGGGANNRVFRVDRHDGARFAPKTYIAPGGDGADRLDAEFAGLSFLGSYGVGTVPRALARADDEGCALYGWIDGEPVREPRRDDIDAALDFVRLLQRLAAEGRAADLAPAREACFSASAIVRQIDARRVRLTVAAAADVGLDRFLAETFAPAYAAQVRAARASFAAAGLDFTSDIEAGLRTLSPSDFGFHNALRTARGGLAFVDFEYFGWDDPVKLTADFLLHPGMALATPLKGRFAQAAVQLFGARDDTFALRLRLLYPLFGLRWSMILLNVFLAEGWGRYAFAHDSADRAAMRHDRLTKAHAMIDQLELEPVFHDA